MAHMIWEGPLARVEGIAYGSTYLNTSFLSKKYHIYSSQHRSPKFLEFPICGYSELVRDGAGCEWDGVGTQEYVVGM